MNIEGQSYFNSCEDTMSSWQLSGHHPGNCRALPPHPAPLRVGTPARIVENRYSIADIALFAYTHVAADGGFDLGEFPAIRGWVDRVRGQEGFVEMG